MAKIVEDGKELKQTKEPDGKEIAASDQVDRIAYKKRLVNNYMECVNTEMERW